MKRAGEPGMHPADRLQVEYHKRHVEAMEKERKASERLHSEKEIAAVEGLTTDAGLFRDYQTAIRAALASKHLARVLASEATYPDRLRAVLSPVNLKEDRSRLSCLAPPAGLEPAT